MNKLKTSMFSIILALIFCLTLSACDDDSNSEDGASSKSPVTTTSITTTTPEATTPEATTPEATTTVEETTAPPVITEANDTPQNDQGTVVYVTDTGKKYHRLGCRSLSQSCHQISLSQARQSYEPCSVCNPPR